MFVLSGGGSSCVFNEQCLVPSLFYCDAYKALSHGLSSAGHRGANEPSANRMESALTLVRNFIRLDG